VLDAEAEQEVGVISRRKMLKTSGAAMAGMAAIPGAWRGLEAALWGQDPQPEPLLQYVDPLIGTGAHGHTYPGATVPFGMVQVSPDNGINGWDWSSGYHYTANRIAGFSHTHLSGTGIGDMYDILLMPAFTEGPPLQDYSSSFSHDDEVALPGYYSVRLRDSGIRAEMTATERAAIHRYTYPNPVPGLATAIVVDLGHSLNWDRPTDTAIFIDGPTNISGHRFSTGWAPDQKLFFAIQFSRPFVSHWLESDWSAPGQHRQLSGEEVRGAFQFLSSPGEGILVKIGISPVSPEGARRNLRQELPNWNFDQVRQDAAAKWERALSRVRVDTPNRDDKVVLYSALYHAMLAPQLFCDTDGSYRGPDGAIHQTRRFDNYSTFSLWDTFRAEHPLLTLVQPERVNDLIQSMMAFYRESGLLPVWSLAGNETNTMIGYHSAPVILEATSKGLTDVDPAEALQAMKRSAYQRAGGLQYYQMPEAVSLAEARQAEARPDMQRIDEMKRDDIRRLGTLISGYSESSSGNTIGYHSPYANVNSALIARTGDGTDSIEWDTDAVPESAAGRPLSFIWLAGIDAGDSRRRFDLTVNGSHWLTFRGLRESDKTLRVDGPGGAILRFKATHRDQHNDLFGFMSLNLPAGLAAGQRLRIQVTGEAAGGRDWYMTFQHAVKNQVTADNVYGLVRYAGRLRQIVRVDVEYLGVSGNGFVRVGEEEPVQGKLEFGNSRFLLPAPLAQQETPIEISATYGDSTIGASEIRLRPVNPYNYLPADWENESVSKTLEYAYDDWCIAEMALMQRDSDEWVFRDRAGYYRNVFDPDTRFMRGRLSDGTWRTPFSPTFSEHRQDDYTEGNAWQYSWYVPHDVRGLIQLMGGREALIAKLDELFEQSSDIEGTNASPDISGLIGQYAQGNEPSQHIAYLYAYAGAPWKTQQRVRQIIDTLYGTTPEGLPGNEDCGQMSAWYIFSAIGFYPVNPAEGIYVIGAPRFERVSIEIGEGTTFTVEAPGVSESNKYIQSATLNGRALDRCYITHDEIVAGGTLAFTMGAEPNRDWAISESAAPPSMTRR
jgi:putative alpha-1,2-mannosidase